MHIHQISGVSNSEKLCSLLPRGCVLGWVIDTHLFVFRYLRLGRRALQTASTVIALRPPQIHLGRSGEGRYHLPVQPGGAVWGDPACSSLSITGDFHPPCGGGILMKTSKSDRLSGYTYGPPGGKNSSLLSIPVKLMHSFRTATELHLNHNTNPHSLPRHSC